MKAIWNLPWVVGGDFNEIRFMFERKGCNRIDSGMKDFGKFCDRHELIDLPMNGAKYTWRSSFSSPNPRLSKIDRFLVWEDHFPTINVSALARPISDHKPIKLSWSYEDWGAPPFRCVAMWFLEASFLSLLKQWWTSFSCSGSASFIMAKKLQLLKEQIKKWNKEVFGRIDRRNEKILADIVVLDQLDDDRTISPSQLATRSNIRLQYEEVADMIYLHWLNKSGAQWFQHGDRNTKYFHKLAKHRRRRNNVVRLRINGSWVEDKAEIKNHIVEHFKSKFERFFSWNELQKTVSFECFLVRKENRG
ncbi:uncharacterized protein LOC113352613 [Papaver somniferum]|uniref:uncharacterized protein LOC113352613 n=1 Tax=Papaver somniferum TaxID=3469 RepID=UPI000E6F534A|nr:uncharacterized protein LOC113352613 [Papaver somniferum]